MGQYITLVDWKTRRADPRVERFWQAKAELSPYEKYQRDWNFIEIEYSERPSNNGLDTANPSFAFMSHLAKYLTIRSTGNGSLYGGKS